MNNAKWAAARTKQRISLPELRKLANREEGDWNPDWNAPTKSGVLAARECLALQVELKAAKAYKIQFTAQMKELTDNWVAECKKFAARALKAEKKYDLLKADHDLLLETHQVALARLLRAETRVDGLGPL